MVSISLLAEIQRLLLSPTVRVPTGTEITVKPTPVVIYLLHPLHP